MEICPPGMLCMNSTNILYFLVGCAIIILYFIQRSREQSSELHNKMANLYTQFNHYVKRQHDTEKAINTDLLRGIHYQNRLMTRTSEYHNPYRPPLRPNPYGELPSISTRGPSSGYSQMGVLVEDVVGSNGATNQKLIPLFGEETYRGSNRYRYFTQSDGYHSVKLPVSFKNRDCQDEQGCEQIYDKDDVSVNGYSQPFKANIYKLETMRYNPDVIH